MKIEPHPSLDTSCHKKSIRPERLAEGVSIMEIADTWWRKAFAGRAGGSRGVVNKYSRRARWYEKKAHNAFER